MAMLNVLYLYNATQTFTNTVFEHINAFAQYSAHRSFFCHHDAWSVFDVDLSRFDAVGIHYSIRMPYDQLSPSAVEALRNFSGLKFLFIQDEYDHTHRAWHWIHTLGVQLVFSVVPEPGITVVYPPEQFPGTRFVNVLTGYVPDGLARQFHALPPSQRRTLIAYRGRPLPVRYGKLGFEKVSIGRDVKAYCDAHGIATDIAWSEEARIYGGGWYDFVTSSRAMLGSESGSNVFDWDGSLVERIARHRSEHPCASDDDIYTRFVAPAEIDGIINQVSPRVFEAIAARTVLVLYEGHYSGVVQAGEHFIALRKDAANLPEVIRLLQDGDYVDAMAERAYRDVIESGRYSYRAFVGGIDENIVAVHATLPGADGAAGLPAHGTAQSMVTTQPLRAQPPVHVPVEPPALQLPPLSARMARRLRAGIGLARYRLREAGAAIWLSLPAPLQKLLKSRVKRLLGME